MISEIQAYDRVLRTYKTYNREKINEFEQILEENGFRERDSYGNLSVYERGHIEVEIGGEEVQLTRYCDEFLQRDLDNKTEIRIQEYLENNLHLINTRLADDKSWIEGETMDAVP